MPLLFFLSLLAQSPHRPLPPRAPETLAPIGLEVHLKAHEDLDPDRLRSFARPRLTLWLETKSNTLKASTLENLPRFDHAYVRLRAPLNDAHARALERAPRCGAWVDASALGGKGLARVLGPRPLAVQVGGSIDEELAGRIEAARPELVEWLAPKDADVLSWSLFRALPGRKLVSFEPGGMPPRPCDAPSDSGPAARVHIASLLALGGSAFPCGKGPRVVVAPDTDRWIIQSLVVRDPTASLELHVGADDVAAKKVSALLDELGFGAAR